MGANHLHEQQRTWSPGQSVLPPDPDGHNRLLDRGAAEHLASVAPWLAPEAPCLSCHAGLCAEHGAARVETTTGAACLLCYGTGVVWMGGVEDRSAWTAPVPCAACRPPAPAAEAKRWRKRPVVVTAVQVTDEWFDGDHPNPLHPVGLRMDPVSRVVEIPTLEGTMTGQVGDWIITGIRGETYPCKDEIFRATYEPADVAPAAEAKGEMSREAFAAALDPCAAQGWLLRHDACLRTRAREAEERADEHSRIRYEQRDCLVRQAERFAAVERERDEAREQRDAATKKRDAWKAVAENTECDRVAQLAAANGRAEAYQQDRDLTAHRLAAAEAEVKRLNHEINVHASGAARAGLERDKMERRLKLATEEIVRVRLAYDDPSLDATDGAHPAWWRGCDHGVRKAAESIMEALGTPQPDRLTDPIEYVRQRVAALRERCRRLEADKASMLERWAIAKAEVPK